MPDPLVLVDDESLLVALLELCRHLRRDPRTRALPVIIVTAHHGERNRALALDAGASDFVTKPFVVEDLIGRLRVLLSPSSQFAGR